MRERLMEGLSPGLTARSYDALEIDALVQRLTTKRTAIRELERTRVLQRATPREDLF